MPKEVRDALTAAKVRQEQRPGRYADGNGLYLHVSETGARWWVWRGTVHGYGQVTLDRQGELVRNPTARPSSEAKVDRILELLENQRA